MCGRNRSAHARWPTVSVSSSLGRTVRAFPFASTARAFVHGPRAALCLKPTFSCSRLTRGPLVLGQMPVLTWHVPLAPPTTSSHPVQAQAQPASNDDPHRRLQRRDGHVQERQVQRLGTQSKHQVCQAQRSHEAHQHRRRWTSLPPHPTALAHPTPPHPIPLVHPVYLTLRTSEGRTRSGRCGATTTLEHRASFSWWTARTAAASMRHDMSSTASWETGI